jgi:hypothetical protein
MRCLRRRERDQDPGAAFTIEVAILRTNAELECVETAEARAGQRHVEMPAADAHARPGQVAPKAPEVPPRRATRHGRG